MRWLLARATLYDITLMLHCTHSIYFQVTRCSSNNWHTTVSTTIPSKTQTSITTGSRFFFPPLSSLRIGLVGVPLFQFPISPFHFPVSPFHFPMPPFHPGSSATRPKSSHPPPCNSVFSITSPLPQVFRKTSSQDAEGKNCRACNGIPNTHRVISGVVIFLTVTLSRHFLDTLSSQAAASALSNSRQTESLSFSSCRNLTTSVSNSLCIYLHFQTHVLTGTAASLRLHMSAAVVSTSANSRTQLHCIGIETTDSDQSLRVKVMHSRIAYHATSVQRTLPFNRLYWDLSRVPKLQALYRLCIRCSNSTWTTCCRAGTTSRSLLPRV
jgi:hypothetical protein